MEVGPLTHLIPDFDRMVLDETPDGVIITAADGVVQHWNRGAELMFGYASNEAVGQSLRQLIIPDDLADEERDILKAILSEGAFHHESLRRRKDKSLIYVDVSGKAVRDAGDNCTYLLFCKKDVTSLKVLRDAKLLEAKFRNLLESIPDGIVITNSTGRIVLANSHAERLFGYGPQAMRGRLIETLMPARYRHLHIAHRAHFAEQPRTREMGADQDLFGLRQDGAEFPVEISLSPLDTEAGAMVMSAIRDISARKRIELALQEKNVELENANLAKDRFLAGMSHELRTPLNAIIGFTGTLLMRLPGPLTVDQDKQLTTIQTSARHLLSLINDLLDLAKIESGKIDLVLEPVSCQQVLEHLAETLQPLAAQKGLQFRLVMPATEIMLRTDLRALRQILINLINNAIKFTEAGEVLVRLSERLVDDEQRVDVSVIDSGVGIKPDDQVKLFQAFSQVDATSTRRFEGTGLGLYLSRKLAALIGGELLFESQSGVGSCFTLLLPETAGTSSGTAP